MRFPFELEENYVLDEFDYYERFYGVDYDQDDMSDGDLSILFLELFPNELATAIYEEGVFQDG